MVRTERTDSEGGTAMPSQQQLRGLCTTCIYVSECLSWRDATQTIVHCELFECEAPSDKAETVVPQSPPEPTETGPEPAGLMGLCVNCNHRRSCTLAKHESGIWHCEEYE